MINTRSNEQTEHEKVIKRVRLLEQSGCMQEAKKTFLSWLQARENTRKLMGISK